jgi:hypothetical protein
MSPSILGGLPMRYHPSNTIAVLSIVVFAVLFSSQAHADPLIGVRCAQNEFGTTKLDGDKVNIVACLYDEDPSLNPAASLSWKSTSGTPRGALMAFNRQDCPAGWSDVPQLNGRVVVASGKYDETSPGNPPAAFSHTYTPGETDGSAQISLSMSQMPRHSHRIRFTGDADGTILHNTNDSSILWTGDIWRGGYVEFDNIGFASAAGFDGFYSGHGGGPTVVSSTGKPGDVYHGSGLWGSNNIQSLLGADGDGQGPWVSAFLEGGKDDYKAGQADPIDKRMPYFVLKFCVKN